MSLDTYANLQTAILQFLGRPGDTDIPVADCIRLFEFEANRRLFTHYQVTTFTFPTIAGTNVYTLPADFKEPRELTITSTNPIYLLDYWTPSALDAEFPSTNSGRPLAYTTEANVIRFAPTPDLVYTLRFEYFATIPALSDTNTSNWLLANGADAYLWGSLTEAELFLDDASETRYQSFLERREASIASINAADRKYRTSGTPLVMRSSLLWTP